MSLPSVWCRVSYTINITGNMYIAPLGPQASPRLIRLYKSDLYREVFDDPTKFLVPSESCNFLFHL